MRKKLIFVLIFWNWPPWVICDPVFNKKTSRNSALSGGFRNRFIKVNAEVAGRTNYWITKRLLHWPLRHRNSPTDGPIQNNRPIDPLLCLSFSMHKALCCKYRNLILQNKALIYFTSLRSTRSVKIACCIRRSPCSFHYQPDCASQQLPAKIIVKLSTILTHN